MINWKALLITVVVFIVVTLFVLLVYMYPVVGIVFYTGLIVLAFSLMSYMLYLEIADMLG